MHAENASTIVHSAFVTLALVVGLIIMRRLRYPAKQHGLETYRLLPALIAGALIGAKLPVFISYGWHMEFLLAGKSYLGAVLGAFVAINLYKRLKGVSGSFGDRYVIPLSVSAGIGKVGCFFYGCCSGTASDWIIAVTNRWGEQVHPVQLYEALFQWSCAGLFYWLYKNNKLVDCHFQLYFLLYLVFRLLIEFIRIEPRVALGLTVYQLMSLIFVPIFGVMLYGRLKSSATVQSVA